MSGNILPPLPTGSPADFDQWNRLRRSALGTSSTTTTTTWVVSSTTLGDLLNGATKPITSPSYGWLCNDNGWLLIQGK